MARTNEDDNQTGDQKNDAGGLEKIPHVHADQNSVAIGGLSIGGELSGELNIAAGDIFKGYTPEQVSILLTKITSRFQPKAFNGRCPYKGLDVFEEDDAGLFFGRDRLAEDLVRRIKESRTVSSPVHQGGENHHIVIPQLACQHHVFG